MIVATRVFWDTSELKMAAKLMGPRDANVSAMGAAERPIFTTITTRKMHIKTRRNKKLLLLQASPYSIPFRISYSALFMQPSRSALSDVYRRTRDVRARDLSI
jgi:hypothetical protein